MCSMFCGRLLLIVPRGTNTVQYKFLYPKRRLQLYTISFLALGPTLAGFFPSTISLFLLFLRNILILERKLWNGAAQIPMCFSFHYASQHLGHILHSTRTKLIILRMIIPSIPSYIVGMDGQNKVLPITEIISDAKCVFQRQVCKLRTGNGAQGSNLFDEFCSWHLSPLSPKSNMRQTHFDPQYLLFPSRQTCTGS